MKIETDIDTYSNQLGGMATRDQWTRIQQWSNDAANKAATAVRVKQIFNGRFGQDLDAEKVVRNFSKRNLTPEENQVLMLRLNFTVTPKSILTDDIIASTEATARELDIQLAEELRSHVSRVLQTAATPKCNLPGHLRRALRELRCDDTIVILPTDKGNHQMPPS